MIFSNDNYLQLREIFQGQRLPLAFIDLAALDGNIGYVARKSAGTGKTIRLGTKSIRCVEIMQRIFHLGGKSLRGFLTYTAEETRFLAGKGFDDFILAYPTVQPSDLEILTELAKAGRQLAVMVDSLDQLGLLSRAGEKAGVVLSVCLEVDLAYRPLGKAFHLGLRRSPIRTPVEAVSFARQAESLPGVRIDTLMGYEGHIAGTSDAIPGASLQNMFMRLVKSASVRELTNRRDAVVQALRREGVELRVVNGGGSGSLVSTLKDLCVTEVTVGSGFYAPGLFHHFTEVSYQPAAFFALQVVRKPASGMIACQGGGYVASGPTGQSKAPLPVMPIGLRYLPLEGAGEVSTPLILPPGCPEIHLGDPIFFQHAKAGELCERFDELYLVNAGQITGKVPTYRGEGQNFL